LFFAAGVAAALDIFNHFVLLGNFVDAVAAANEANGKEAA